MSLEHTPSNLESGLLYSSGSLEDPELKNLENTTSFEEYHTSTTDNQVPQIDDDDQFPIKSTLHEKKCTCFNTAPFKIRLSAIEYLLLFIYPCTLFLGSFIQLLDIVPLSYFSDKRNIINTYLIKRGWFWVSLITAYHSFNIYRRKSAHRHIAIRNIAVRYVLASVWWIFFAQWFFGSPLMDKIFIFTGGSCSEIGVENYSTTSVSSAQCRSMGGKWGGGHDPSGHTFLMVHSSLYILMEILPYICDNFRDRFSKPIRETDVSFSAREKTSSVAKSLFIKISIAFLAIYWWMLLMTCVYFHSFLEKLVGMIWGYTGTVIVFILAVTSFIPSLQEYLVVIPV